MIEEGGQVTVRIIVLYAYANTFEHRMELVQALRVALVVQERFPELVARLWSAHREVPQGFYTLWEQLTALHHLLLAEA